MRQRWNRTTLPFFFLVLCQWDLSRKFLRTSQSGESCKLRWTTTRGTCIWPDMARKCLKVDVGSELLGLGASLRLIPEPIWYLNRTTYDWGRIYAANRLGVRTVWWNCGPNLPSTRFRNGTVVCVWYKSWVWSALVGEVIDKSSPRPEVIRCNPGSKTKCWHCWIEGSNRSHCWGLPSMLRAEGLNLLFRRSLDASSTRWQQVRQQP